MNRNPKRKGSPLTAFSVPVSRKTNLNQLNLLNHELAGMTPAYCPI